MVNVYMHYSAEEAKDGPAIVKEASLFRCLCSPQVVLHTHKLWDLLLVLPLPDLLLLILKNKKKRNIGQQKHCYGPNPPEDEIAVCIFELCLRHNPDRQSFDGGTSTLQ